MKEQEAASPAEAEMELRRQQMSLLLKVVAAGLTLYCIIFMSWAGVLWSQNSELLVGQQKLLIKQATIETKIAELEQDAAEQREALLRLGQEQQRIEVEFSRRMLRTVQ